MQGCKGTGSRSDVYHNVASDELSDALLVGASKDGVGGIGHAELGVHVALSPSACDRSHTEVGVQAKTNSTVNAKNPGDTTQRQSDREKCPGAKQHPTQAKVAPCSETDNMARMRAELRRKNLRADRGVTIVLIVQRSRAPHNQVFELLKFFFFGNKFEHPHSSTSILKNWI